MKKFLLVLMSCVALSASAQSKLVRFGVEGGVRRSFDAVTGRWETLPVVAPYYNVNGKFRLQFDTGPLIHKLLREAIYGREGRGNPTIAPPKNHIELM